MEQRCVEFLLRTRYFLSAISVALVIFLSYGMQQLYFDSDYKSYFDKSDPQRLANEALNREYTKADSLIFLIKSAQDDIFSARMLSIIHEITEAAWLTPYGVRVDSLTNFQYSEAEQDSLYVDALVSEPKRLTPKTIKRIREIALNDTEIVNRLIAADGNTSAISVSVELPEVDPEASLSQQSAQQAARENSFAAITHYGLDIASKIKAMHPDVDIHLIGVPVANYSFNDSTEKDLQFLIPLMYGTIILVLAIIFRSLGSVIACIIVIAFATTSGMGMAGWIGYSLNAVTAMTPVIILTIAVCDAVHIIAIYHRHLSLGETRLQAMRESLLVNLQPVLLTSITTAVGFLTLNFSDGPLYRALGNTAALGVLVAMMISLTLLPAIVIALVKHTSYKRNSENMVSAISEFVITRPRKVLCFSLLGALILLALIPLNQPNNDVINYFKKGVSYRDAAIFSQNNLPGIKSINFSIDCGSSNCITEPSYLKTLEALSQWVDSQEHVEYVVTYTNLMKRLNRNMHGDNPEHYQLPENNELAAQYQLLYEMSLPYGLDLYNMVNFDKSATRLSVWLEQVTTPQMIGLEQRVVDWLIENAPDMETRGSSVDMMFAYQFTRNLRSMGIGAIFAIIGVTLTLLIATRSIKHGLLSVFPNAFPAAMALGVWGVIVGEVNGAVAVVFSITLGLVVDNTVHFISKYRRALNKGNTADDAVRYAFSTVGNALIVTAIVLSAGFGLLALSSFNLNAYMGGLTAITIVLALAFDFMLLPAMLLLIDKKSNPKVQ
jgi:hypothetical protein